MQCNAEGTEEMEPPDNDYDALVLALRLAINAPDDDRAQECATMAEEIDLRLSEFDVERAKKEAIQ